MVLSARKGREKGKDPDMDISQSRGERPEDSGSPVGTLHGSSTCLAMQNPTLRFISILSRFGAGIAGGQQTKTAGHWQCWEGDWHSRGQLQLGNEVH